MPDSIAPLVDEAGPSTSGGGGGGGAKPAAPPPPPLLRAVHNQSAGRASGEPIYSKSHAEASILACRVPVADDFLLTAPPEAQLAWLHDLNVRIDAVLERVPATKVSLTGNTMLFVSGAENGDADHVATLVRLADELDALGRPASGGGGGGGDEPAPPTGPPLRLPGGRPLRFQMGLASGPVASGIVGTAALRYGVYGPTVALARALEAASAPGVLRATAESVAALQRRAGGSGGDADATTAALVTGWRDGGDLVVSGGGGGGGDSGGGRGSPRRVGTRIRGRDAGLAPLADLRAAAAAVGAGWDAAARGLPRSATRAPPLAAALAAGRARALAATDATVFGCALAGTVVYGGAMAAAGRLVSLSAVRVGGSGGGSPFDPHPAPAAVPAPAIAAACLVWAAALGAAGSPGYAGPPRDALALGLRALAAVPRVWRVYAGVPGLVARGATAAAAGGGPLAPVGAAVASAAARAAAAVAAAPPGVRAGLVAAAPQAALAALLPVPLPAAVRAAAACAVLAAASAAGGSGLLLRGGGGGGLWTQATTVGGAAAYAVLGVLLPLALQAVADRLAVRRMLRQLTA